MRQGVSGGCLTLEVPPLLSPSQPRAWVQAEPDLSHQDPQQLLLKLVGGTASTSTQGLQPHSLCTLGKARGGGGRSTHSWVPGSVYRARHGELGGDVRFRSPPIPLSHPQAAQISH